ncbi:hypothetical protein WDU94_015487 [Cyamophila willieti]
MFVAEQAKKLEQNRRTKEQHSSVETMTLFIEPAAADSMQYELDYKFDNRVELCVNPRRLLKNIPAKKKVENRILGIANEGIKKFTIIRHTPQDTICSNVAYLKSVVPVPMSSTVVHIPISDSISNVAYLKSVVPVPMSSTVVYPSLIAAAMLLTSRV